MRDFRHPKKLWIPGTLRKCTGPLTFCVQVGHRQVKVHIDHMLPSRSSEQQHEGINDDMFDCLPVGGMQRAGTSDPEGQPDQIQEAQPERRYPQRQRKAPQRLNL